MFLLKESTRSDIVASGESSEDDQEDNETSNEDDDDSMGHDSVECAGHRLQCCLNAGRKQKPIASLLKASCMCCRVSADSERYSTTWVWQSFNAAHLPL